MWCHKEKSLLCHTGWLLFKSFQPVVNSSWLIRSAVGGFPIITAGVRLPASLSACSMLDLFSGTKLHYMPPLCCSRLDQREGCQGTLGDYCRAPQLLSCQCRGNPQGTLCCLCKGWDFWARSCIMLSRSAGLGSPNGQDGLNYWCCLLIPPLIALCSEASVVTRCRSCCATIQQHDPLGAQAVYGGEMGTLEKKQGTR